MFVTLVFTSKALAKASPQPSFDGQQQKYGLFYWGGGLEASLLVSRPMDCFVTQNLDMFSGKACNSSWGCCNKMHVFQTVEHLM